MAIDWRGGGGGRARAGLGRAERDRTWLAASPEAEAADFGINMFVPSASIAVPRMLAQGQRVLLRTFTRADMPYLAGWADSPFVDAMVGSELLYQYKHLYHRRTDFFLELLMRDWSQLNAVIVPLKGDASPVGFTRLFNINLVHGYGFVETVIADPRHTRKGWGVEGTRLLLYYGIEMLGIRRVEAKVYAYNRLSINALTRNGFTQEGVLREACFHDGRYSDIIVFGILKDVIEAKRKRDQITLYHPDGAPL
jgi:RimJ/RimL family protein N-acetyltransferase